MPTCEYPDCGRHIAAKGLCQSHYLQQKRGEPLRPIQFQNKPRVVECTGPECDRPGTQRGLCPAHAKQRDKGQELRPLWSTKNRQRMPCSVEGCDRLSAKRGLCQTHARYAARGVTELKPIAAPKYRYLNKEGYVRLFLPDHANAAKNGMVLEHVVVMSDHLGRPLTLGENVHHKNGVRDDNRIENLELWVSSQPKGQRVADLVQWAREVLARYEHEVEEHPRLLGG